MKLIGAGLPRTATLTQKVGLEMLGLGPCYHMVNVLSDSTQAPIWADAIEGNADWPSVFAGFESTVDYPGSFFYKELVEAFPDAKVLLSVRSPESWAKSMSATIGPFLYGDTMMHNLSMARALIDPGWNSYLEMLDSMWKESGIYTGPQDQNPEHLMEIFEKHNNEVREFVPAERLLVWQPTDGWEPLCEFLEVPVPAEALPNINDTATFAVRIIDAALGKLNEWNEAQAASVAQ